METSEQAAAGTLRPPSRLSSSSSIRKGLSGRGVSHPPPSAFAHVYSASGSVLVQNIQSASGNLARSTDGSSGNHSTRLPGPYERHLQEKQRLSISRPGGALINAGEQRLAGQRGAPSSSTKVLSRAQSDKASLFHREMPTSRHIPPRQLSTRPSTTFSTASSETPPHSPPKHALSLTAKRVFGGNQINQRTCNATAESDISENIENWPLGHAHVEGEPQSANQQKWAFEEPRYSLTFKLNKVAANAATHQPDPLIDPARDELLIESLSARPSGSTSSKRAGRIFAAPVRTSEAATLPSHDGGILHSPVRDSLTVPKTFSFAALSPPNTYNEHFLSAARQASSASRFGLAASPLRTDEHVPRLPPPRRAGDSMMYELPSGSTAVPSMRAPQCTPTRDNQLHNRTTTPRHTHTPGVENTYRQRQMQRDDLMRSDLMRRTLERPKTVRRSDAGVNDHAPLYQAPSISDSLISPTKPHGHTPAALEARLSRQSIFGTVESQSIASDCQVGQSKSGTKDVLYDALRLQAAERAKRPLSPDRTAHASPAVEERNAKTQRRQGTFGFRTSAAPQSSAKSRPAFPSRRSSMRLASRASLSNDLHRLAASEEPKAATISRSSSVSGLLSGLADAAPINEAVTQHPANEASTTLHQVEEAPQRVEASRLSISDSVDADMSVMSEAGNTSLANLQSLLNKMSLPRLSSGLLANKRRESMLPVAPASQSLGLLDERAELEQQYHASARSVTEGHKGQMPRYAAATRSSIARGSQPVSQQPDASNHRQAFTLHRSISDRRASWGVPQPRRGSLLPLVSNSNAARAANALGAAKATSHATETKSMDVDVDAAAATSSSVDKENMATDTPQLVVSHEEQADTAAVLKGVVAFVDVKTAEGDEAGHVFVEILRSLGARVRFCAMHKGSEERAEMIWFSIGPRSAILYSDAHHLQGWTSGNLTARSSIQPAAPAASARCRLDCRMQRSQRASTRRTVRYTSASYRWNALPIARLVQQAE